ncbi:MAG: hypothetical protein O7C59_10570 [Rickettsia endosymbiont of Ixodes persulcatus]|nr:hypothetical protein [Rickettsia endosymbiont of Ixodes persulcatus]
MENVDLEGTVSLINSILDQCNQVEISNYIKLLQNSKFYLHRLAVPYLIKNRELENLKDYLKNAMEDAVEYVVRTVILTLKEYDNLPFTDDEIVNYANIIFESGSDYLEANCVDLLLLVDFEAPLMEELLVSDSWKIKLSLSKKIYRFKFDVKKIN